MNRNYSILFLFLLLTAGSISCADSLSSQIVCNGAAFVSSSLIGQGQTYAAHLFASDLAVLIRSLDLSDMVQTETSLRSDGPMGVEEYSAHIPEPRGDDTICWFSDPENRSVRTEEILSEGLFDRGRYHSFRRMQKGTTAMTTVNGSGVFLVRSGSYEENQSGSVQTSLKADIMGEMNMSETVLLGDG